MKALVTILTLILAVGFTAAVPRNQCSWKASVDQGECTKDKM